jgi:glycosyltransferase involved in cell wall biosynthesis
MKLTCICPCWGRPERTIRAIESVLAQKFEGAETLFIGDNCPFFQQRLDDGTFTKYAEQAKANGNKMVFKNLEVRGGGWGHMARKEGIEMAQGKYICFLDNDDVLKPEHFESYYSFMEANPDFDAGYVNAYTVPWNKERVACLSRGGIGNAELIFKAEALKNEYQPDAEYEHDWRLVERMIKKKYKFVKSKNPSTYMIMSIPNFRETTID